jgi:hypothetical protein
MEAWIIFLLVAGALRQFVGIIEVAGRASEVPWLEPALAHVRRWPGWWADHWRRGSARLRRFLRSIVHGKGPADQTVAEVVPGAMVAVGEGVRGAGELTPEN